MEHSPLNDKSVQPNDELIFSIIGDKQQVWEQTIAYLYDHNNDITENWNYYNDGKCWLLKITKKKKTICWIRVMDDTFRIAFWYAVKYEDDILESNLPRHLKDQYNEAKPFNRSKCIYIDVTGPTDLENIKILIDLKIKLK